LSTAFVDQPAPAPIEEGPAQFSWASDMQRDAVEAPPGSPLLLIGGFNSGKTTAAILRALTLCQTFPGYKVAVLRKTFSDLRLTTRPSFDQWIKPEFVKTSNEKEVVLSNGSSFIFHHLDRPDSATILKGLEINAAILDQAEQMQEQTFTILLGRLGRWKGAKVPAWALHQREGDWPWKDKGGTPVPPMDVILTANPSEDGDPELHWLWQRFSPESPAFHKKYAPLGYRSMTMPTTDNKFAGEQNIEMLMQQDEDYRKRFVEGVWVKSKGHLFRIDESSLLDYDPDLMVQIQNNMNLGRGLDHGDSAPTCCLWYAVDGENNIFIWQEYYQAGITESGEFDISDHRRAITMLSKPLTFRTNIADPSIFNRTRGITGYNKHAKRWCLSPETPILTSDLRHVRVDSLAVGDIIAGFDEGNPSEDFRSRAYKASDRAWREAVVEDVREVHLPSYRITLDDGSEIVCSEGHQWLINPTGQWRLWRSTKRLKVGQRMLRATDVWETDTSHGAGYLAAAFDGEGFLTQHEKNGKRTFRAGFSQVENEMLARVERELEVRGYHPSKSRQSESASKTGKPCVQLCLSRRPEVLRLLGQIRPERLLPKLRIDDLGRIHAMDRPTITRIEYLGVRRLVGLQTSTKTLIAHGLMSHNSVADEYRDTRIIQEQTSLIWRPADNNEELSRSRLKQYLRLDKYHRHPVTGEPNAPHLYFIKQSPDWPHGCNHAISETRAAKRLQVGESDGKPIYGDDRDPDVPDHALDVIRYIVNSRPLPASGLNPQMAKPKKEKAIVEGDRVLITVPSIKHMPKRFQMTPERGAWKSKGGGYVVFLASLLSSFL